MEQEPAPLIVAFLGWSDSGKTTLIVRLIEECGRRGITCAAAKCTRHAGDLEPAGKDSARYRAAGASPVAFVGTGDGATTALFMPTPREPDRAWLTGLFPGARLIFAEGLEVEGSVRVLVDREGQEPKRAVGEMDIVISDREELRRLHAGGATRFFGHGETPAIIDALLGARETAWKGK